MEGMRKAYVCLLYTSTTWLYHVATGLELKKTYADGSCVSKTYDGLNLSLIHI